jgi:hypothetical protein
MRIRSKATRPVACAALALAAGVVASGGCEQAKEALETDVTGRVVDDDGRPIEGATVRLYGLLDNTDFVEGGDVRAGEAYIARAAILASDNALARGQTGADGSFRLRAVPNAFLAVATRPGCTADFAGFDDQSGVLNVDTLIVPRFEGGVSFEIPAFALACATPPEVGPSGNGPEAPPYEPPVAPQPACDAAECAAAGGACEGGACAVACAPAACAAAGGACEGGACVTPACDAAACAAAGGACSPDGSACQLPACDDDDDCRAAQPGAVCVNPGDVATAACRPPSPGEVVPPPQAAGWTALRVTDAAGAAALADAGAGDGAIAAAAVPADGLVRVYGTYAGAAAKAFLHVQSGGTACGAAVPCTDHLTADIVDGHLATAEGDFLRVVLHGGYQKLQLSTSEVVGEGERSYTVEVAERCAPPKRPFAAALTWEAGPGEPADLDLAVWNAAGDLVFLGNKQAAWGRLAHEGKGPGPEVFESDDPGQGPFTIKVRFFCGKPRDVRGKVRITRTVGGAPLDESYAFTVRRPKDVVDVGVFASR